MCAQMSVIWRWHVLAKIHTQFGFFLDPYLPSQRLHAPKLASPELRSPRTGAALPLPFKNSQVGLTKNSKTATFEPFGNGGGRS